MEFDSTTFDEPLKNFVSLRSLEEYQFSNIKNLIEVREFKEGETIFKEGTESDELYLILRGSVLIFQADSKDRDIVPLVTLHAREEFGESGFLASTPRSASTRALEDLKVAVLSRRSIEENHSEARSVLNTMKGALSQLMIDRFRWTNKQFSKVYRENSSNLKSRLEFAELFIFVVISFGVMSVLTEVAELYEMDVKGTASAWVMLGLLGFISFLLVKRSSHTLSELGVGKERLLSTIVQSLIIIPLLAAVCFGSYLGYNKYLPSNEWLKPNLDRLSWALIFRYLASVALQEFLCRGIMQTSLQRFMLDTKGTKSIIVTSVLFATLHVHHGIGTVIVTLVAGLIFGYIFVKQKNLIGVILIHWAIGLIAIWLNLV